MPSSLRFSPLLAAAVLYASACTLSTAAKREKEAGKMRAPQPVESFLRHDFPDLYNTYLVSNSGAMVAVMPGLKRTVIDRAGDTLIDLGTVRGFDVNANRILETNEAEYGTFPTRLEGVKIEVKKSGDRWYTCLSDAKNNFQRCEEAEDFVAAVKRGMDKVAVDTAVTLRYDVQW